MINFNVILNIGMSKKEPVKKETEPVETSNQSEEIKRLQDRICFLEDRLYIACEGLFRIGNERDGKVYTERYGVDAAAARTILSTVGQWQRTFSAQNPAAAQLQPPAVLNARKEQPLFKKVEWSKDPNFRGVY